MEGEGGGKGVVRMGDESKMNGGRMRGLGVAESPCVWLDLADSMLSEEWEELGDRFGRWSRLNWRMISVMFITM